MTIEERIREVIETYEVKKVADGVYSVRHPKVAEAYTVDLRKGSCTCKAGQAGKVCRHILACRRLFDEELAQQRKQEEAKREEVIDLLQRFAEAEETKLWETLTPGWTLKVLKAMSERILTLEKETRKLRGELSELNLKALL